MSRRTSSAWGDEDSSQLFTDPFGPLGRSGRLHLDLPYGSDDPRDDDDNLDSDPALDPIG